MHTISFQTVFVRAFRIVVDSWKFTMLLLYILWDDWPIVMISGSNQQLQQELEYTLRKPDWHSWWISKMQSGRENTLEERYAIEFCFKLGKNDATETYGPCFRLFLDHLAWIEHQFLSGIRDSRKAGSLWEMMRGCCYETIEEMKEAVTKVIDTLTQKDFHRAFQKLLEWYNSCIAAGGDYFEGD